MHWDGSGFPYISNTDDDRRRMLAAIGVESAGELFEDIPAERRDPALRLPARLSEPDLLRELREVAARNASPSTHHYFLGGGVRHHLVPAVVDSVLRRGEFATCYTPYQAEVSQGTLQTAFEFQSLVCQLMGMDVANAGMYDGATALAEATLMACRVTGRDEAVLLDTASPRYSEVIRTYTRAQGLRVRQAPAASPGVGHRTACLVVQSPNFYGCLEDLAGLERAAHGQGALLVVSMDPIAMALFKPPGEYGADVATAEGQPLGMPLSFGGPHLGLLTSRERFLRQLPGRVVGLTADTEGREGFVMTLQTREQHIRRERATSNICTSTQLMALAATVYLAAMGKHGTRRVAELCYHKAHYAAGRIADLPGFELPFDGHFFNEFTVRCPVPPSVINRRLLSHNIVGGLDISDAVPNGMLVAVTEMNRRDDIDGFVDALAEAAR